MLHEFLSEQRENLIARCERKVASRRTALPPSSRQDHGVPLFLDQLIETLRTHRESSSEIGETATKHGGELLLRGFTVDQVVHDYGDVCQAVSELAGELDAPITTDEFRTLNRCLDDAIADAVTEYGRLHVRSVAAEHAERHGVVVHELRNLVNSATLAFEALSSGSVGVRGNTGAVLGRCLAALRRLADQSLTDIRLNAGIQYPVLVAVAELVDEICLSGVLEARARGVKLEIVPVVGDPFVRVDRQTLASVLANLLMNAFKFTRPGGSVLVETSVVGDGVCIEVSDECGGLPSGRAEELFRPFEQQGADRSGLGLGLAICKRGVEANGGTLGVRDVPGKGCVFSVELPRTLALVDAH